MIDYKDIQTLYPCAYLRMMEFFYPKANCFPTLEKQDYISAHKDRELYDFFDACGIFVSVIYWKHIKDIQGFGIDIAIHPNQIWRREKIFDRRKVETIAFKEAFEELNNMIVNNNFVPEFLTEKHFSNE